MTQYNPELIEKARKGEIAILNDGSVAELQQVIDHAAPNCVKPDGRSTYYFISNNGGWSQSKFNGNNLPAHSVKDFFMIDTKDPESLDNTVSQQSRTYRITRQQMKHIWDSVSDSSEKITIRNIVKDWIDEFEDEGELTEAETKLVVENLHEFSELLRQVFPGYFHIPEGEPVLVKMIKTAPWEIRVSDGRGGVFFGARLQGESSTFKFIIPFTKNPPKLI